MNSDNLYKTGSDMRIFISVIGNGQPMWVDDCLGISYSENTQKTPIFGYASKFFDAMAEGPTIITGNFTIAARGARTLAALRRYAQIVNSNTTDIDELKDMYWKRKAVGNAISTGQSYQFLETSAPLMNIAIVYGGYDENNDFEVTSTKVIRYVYINNAQEGFAQDDSPLVRTFSFIARTIENDFNLGTITGRRSSLTHTRLRPISTDVYHPSGGYPTYEDIAQQDIVLPIQDIIPQYGVEVPVDDTELIDQQAISYPDSYGIMDQQPIPINSPESRIDSMMGRMNNFDQFQESIDDLNWQRWTGGHRPNSLSDDSSSVSDMPPDTVSEAVEQADDREDEHNEVIVTKTEGGTTVTTDKSGNVTVSTDRRERRQ